MKKIRFLSAILAVSMMSSAMMSCGSSDSGSSDASPTETEIVSEEETEATTTTTTTTVTTTTTTINTLKRDGVYSQLSERFAVWDQNASNLQKAVDTTLTDLEAKGIFEEKFLSKYSLPDNKLRGYICSEDESKPEEASPLDLVKDKNSYSSSPKLIKTLMLTGITTYFPRLNEIEFVAVVDETNCPYVAVSYDMDSVIVGVYESPGCPYKFSGTTLREILDDVKKQFPRTE